MHRAQLRAAKLVICFVTALIFTTSTPQAESSPSQKPLQPVELVTDSRPKEAANKNPANQKSPLNITDLKLEMAESTWKVRHSLRALTDLVNALEAHLNQNCFGDMLRTLAYSGSPTNPDCIAKMERLFDLYPNNPVATCLRDGIESQSCSDSYREQSMKQFSGNYSSFDQIPDPALKVGLSAQDREKLKALNETLGNLNSDYRGATTDADKLKLTENAMHLYDQALSIACKIVAVDLEDPESGTKKEQEDYAVREIREKLLKVPPALRREYQDKLMTEAEEELAKAKDSETKKKLIMQKIAAIQNPDTEQLPSTAGKLRYRVVLPECYELVGKAGVLLPNLPSPTCHRDGWQSPQCLVALKKWRAYKSQVEEMKRRQEKINAPTPPSQISSF
jgi:hypothetical protein